MALAGSSRPESKEAAYSGLCVAFDGFSPEVISTPRLLLYRGALCRAPPDWRIRTSAKSYAKSGSSRLPSRVAMSDASGSGTDRAPHMPEVDSHDTKS